MEFARTFMSTGAKWAATDEESKQDNKTIDEASEKLLKNEDFQTKYNEFMMASISKNDEEEEKGDKVPQNKRTMTTVQEEDSEYQPETTEESYHKTTEESAFRKTTEISDYDKT
jgi:hypothetical protein